jgi:hypothetical protein
MLGIPDVWFGKWWAYLMFGLANDGHTWCLVWQMMGIPDVWFGKWWTYLMFGLANDGLHEAAGKTPKNPWAGRALNNLLHKIFNVSKFWQNAFYVAALLRTEDHFRPLNKNAQLPYPDHFNIFNKTIFKSEAVLRNRNRSRNFLPQRNRNRNFITDPSGTGNGTLINYGSATVKNGITTVDSE